MNKVFRFRFLLAWCCLFAVTVGHGQKFSFLEYSNNVGLPQSQVLAITQDKEGYLWVGTLGGLAKFNGKKFTTFPLEQGILNNRISCLAANGNEIWVGHQGGVSTIREQKAYAWKFPDKEQNNNVTAILQFENKIYAAVEGGGVYCKSKGEFKPIRFPNEDASICRALLVYNKRLFVGTRDGLYEISAANQVKKIKTFGSFSVSGLSVSNGKLMVTTFNDGFFESDSKVKVFTNLNTIKDLYISNSITDNNGRLWSITDLGLLSWKSKNSYKYFSDKNGMPTSSLNCVFQDHDGHIWIGSDGKGLLRFCGEQWAYYNSSQNLPSDLILSSTKFQGSYVFGTYDQGAFKMSEKGEVTRLNIAAATVWCMTNYLGELYIGTDIGLFKLSTAGKAEKISGIDHPIHTLYKSKNGLMVVGENEIGWMKQGRYSKIPFSHKIYNRLGIIRTYTELEGKSYIGTSNGLFKVDLNELRIDEQKKFGSGVFNLCIDNSNRLWIGTENGLFYFDGIVYRSCNIGKQSGSKFINFLVSIDESIIAGTNNGIFMISADEKPYVIDHFGLNSGLINLETNINSAHFDGKYLWFGTAEGLVRYDYSLNTSENSYNFNPTLVSTGFNVNFEPYNFNFSSVFGSQTAQLNLTYNKNNVSIDLDALYLSDPESVLIQYWVEGLDEKWSPPSSNTTITLNNLPDGEFILHIRGVNDFGTVSDSIDIPIYIRPPYYRTWWFYVIILIAVGAGIRYYFRWQIKRERDKNYQENLENRTRLLALEQQSLNASMNRHFIFNSLNSIQYFINTQDKHSANRYLSNFAKLIRKNLDSATENDNMVSLHQELERLELYLSLESMRFKDRFTYEIDTDDVDTEQIEVPSMLLQPFVENSIIHGILPNEAVAGKIEIRLKVISHQLEICIDDNGIGIDVSMNKKASFAGDHKSKGMEITSKRISLIRTMLKKDYDLIGPFQITNPDSSIKGTRVLIKIPYENLEN